MTLLILRLKKEWFEKIKSGEKTHEYRKYDYWYSRIHKAWDRAKANNKDLCIKFICGYPKKNSVQEFQKSLIVKVEDISVVPGHDTDLKINELVVDIKFSVLY